MTKRKYHFIAAPEFLGGPRAGTELSPSRLRSAGLLESLSSQGHQVQWTDAHSQTEIKELPPEMGHLSAMPSIAKHSEALSKCVMQVVKNKEFPIVIGGDHSIAVGTWSGVAESYGKDIGLIWFDAHMDAHTPETSHTQAIHGMPIASLLGYGDQRLSHLVSTQPKINPKKLVLIGIRSFEKEEAALLESLGVRIFMMEEIKKKSFKVVFDEALEIVCKDTVGFGISIDLDGFDPKEVPGVGTPAKNGIEMKDAFSSLSCLAQNPKILAIEIAELNPSLDLKTGRSVEFTKSLISTLLSEK